MLTLDVLHADFSGKRWQELRFDPNMRISEVKERLQRCSGTAPAAMKVFAFNEEKGVDESSIALIDDSKTLSDYQISGDLTLFVVDTDQHSIAKELNNLEKTTEESKFRISDEDYNKRTDSARAFLMSLRRNKPDLFKHPVKSEKDTKAEHELEQSLKMLKTGMRCEIKSLGGVRGEICWIGKREKMDGYWVGICLDEPIGSCDGTDRGTRLFKCQGPRYGQLILFDSQFLFNIATGDYPPLNLFEMDEI